jgi:hypothetical protein
MTVLDTSNVNRDAFSVVEVAMARALAVTENQTTAANTAYSNDAGAS